MDWLSILAADGKELIPGRYKTQKIYDNNCFFCIGHNLFHNFMAVTQTLKLL